MALVTEFFCLSFGKVVRDVDQVNIGDIIKRKWILDVLEEICLISKLDIQDLEEDDGQ